jgi:hypothetical protein
MTSISARVRAFARVLLVSRLRKDAKLMAPVSIESPRISIESVWRYIVRSTALTTAVLFFEASDQIPLALNNRSFDTVATELTQPTISKCAMVTLDSRFAVWKKPVYYLIPQQSHNSSSSLAVFTVPPVRLLCC